MKHKHLELLAEKRKIYGHSADHKDDTFVSTDDAIELMGEFSKLVAIDFAKWVEGVGYIPLLDGIMSSKEMKVEHKGWSRFDEDKIITDDELWQEYHKRNMEREG